MIRKFNHRFLCSLFHLLAYLADRSNGAALFVRPKLVIGGVIVGLGVTFPEKVVAQKPFEDEKIPLPVQTVFPDSAKLKTEEESEPFCYMMDPMPEYPGGIDEMMKFLGKNIIYPKEAVDKQLSGIVVCSFIVDIDGAIKGVKLIRGITPILDKEAIRVIKSFPKWIPGKQGGKSVPVKYTLPIRFTLPDKKQ